MDGTTTTRRVAVLVATCSSFLIPFMGSSLNIALPSIGREFFISALVLGWISTAYLLALCSWSLSANWPICAAGNASLWGD